MNSDNSKQRLSTVDRAMSLLTLFLKYESLSLVDIEREMEISKTAAFRLAVTMSERGFLVKDAKTKQYSPGPILFQLVRKFEVNDIVTISQPFIQELARITEETVYLSIRSGHRYIYITGVDSTKALKVTSPIGDELDLYYGAAGKLHMAFMSLAEIDNYLKRTVFESFTPYTRSNKKQLSEDLARIREYGYSVSLGERESESGGVAVPIWGQEEEPTAVLGIYLPLTRMRQQKLVKLAMEYADQIATKFNTKKAGGS